MYHQKNIPLGFAPHDHSECVSTSLTKVNARCIDEGLRLTPVRRKVLEILLAEHRAIGAYAILKKLGEHGFGSQPPVVYRALDFLVEHGFVHKIERLNAFVACTAPDDIHAPAFMICRCCKAIAETSASTKSGVFGEAIEELGFQVEVAVIEIEGLCPECVGGVSK